MKYALRDYQQRLVSQIFDHWKEGRKRVLLQSGTGTGKCLVKGTPVLMYDGTIKPVEEIQVGDVLMGDDSTPRNVLSTTTGTEMCYDIAPVKGERWGCNESHILSLACNGNSGNFKKGMQYDIELWDYMSLSMSDKHVLKQYRVGVNFPDLGIKLPINPYFLGLWLGDGTSSQVSISNPDDEVIEYLQNFGAVRNMEKRPGKCPIWLFPAKENTDLIGSFKSLNLLRNKHIPQIYKAARWQDRLQLLAGILDTDGHLNSAGFEITAKSNTLASDILFLARSLGFAAYVKTRHVKLKGWNESRPYNRIFISGDVCQIPVKIERKKPAERRQIKNVLRTGFTVKPRGKETYYGFEIDGNRRFLLGDFTVTHNTVMFNHIVNLAQKKGKRVLVIADRRELITQTWQRLWDAHGVHAGIIMSGHAQAFSLPVQIGSVQTLNRRTFPPGIDLVVIDECRSSIAPSYEPIFKYYDGAHFLGVDATPVRTSGQGFDHIYDAMVCGPSIKEMEMQGALIPAKSFINPISQNVLDKIKITAGDYNEQQLARAMSAENITADLVASWKRYANGKKTLVFAVDIEHSKAIVEQYKKAGIEAAHVDGSFSTDQREAIFKALKTGRIQVLSNVGIATYGVDFPWLEAVQAARPTKSLSLYLQMCLDSKTEILTKRGWLSHSEITDYDLVYGLDVCTNECRLVPIQEIVIRPLHAEEKMYAIKSPHLDIRITGGHDMLTKPRRRPNMKWRKVTAIEASNLKDMYTVPVSAIEAGTVGAKLTDSEIEFIGWFLSDGTRNKTTNAIAISQSCSAPERCDKIRGVLRGCGLKFGEHRVVRKDHMRGYSDLIQFTVSHGKPRGTDKHLTGYARLEMWADKAIPEIFETLDCRQFRILISALWMGDGRKMTHVDYIPRTLSITCGDNKLMADRIQSLCIRRGLRCNVSIEKKEGRLFKYNLHIKERTTSTISGVNCKNSKIGHKTVGRTKLVEVEAPEGELVWCVKNELGTIFTRRNGMVVITGNCGRGARPFEGMSHYLLLDHANWIMEHGEPNAERKWTLKSTASKKPKAKKFIVKQAGKQMQIMSEREVPAQADGVELVELTPETMRFYKNVKRFNSIHSRQKSNGYKPLWAYFQYAQKYPDEMGLQELQYIGTRLGFKPGWGYFKHKELQEKEKVVAKEQAERLEQRTPHETK